MCGAFKRQQGEWRLHAGEWRVLIRLDLEACVIVVTAVKPRGRAYDR
jgi:mRNA-degrading endonuclease RelE of RelBE toxin-antitoxin system